MDNLNSNNLTMISFTMKQILDDIIKNKNEKLFQNYLLLLKLLTKQQKLGGSHEEKISNVVVLNPQDFYAKVIKNYLSLNNIESLIYVFEVKYCLF